MTDKFNQKHSKSISSPRSSNHPPDSSPDEAARAIALNDSISTVKKVSLLGARVRDVDKRLRNVLISEGKYDQDDFDFAWEEDSEEFKLLYSPEIHPFVSSTGERMTILKILTRRQQAAERDPDAYGQNKDRAKKGMERRRKRAQEWDYYRMYESSLILPFIDRKLERHSSEAISKAREMRPYRPIGKYSKRVEALQHAKQTFEFYLMIVREDVKYQKCFAEAVQNYASIQSKEIPKQLETANEFEDPIKDEEVDVLLQLAIGQENDQNVSKMEMLAREKYAAKARRIANNELMTQQQKISVLYKSLQEIDDQLKMSLIARSEYDQDDFDFAWEEDSEEFKLLYSPEIHPFVSSTGENISVLKILTRRQQAAERDPDAYGQNKDRAKKGMERRRKRAQEWDYYRMYVSSLILPFIDRNNVKHTIQTISKARSTRPRLLGTPHMSSDCESIETLRHAKLIHEYYMRTVSGDL